MRGFRRIVLTAAVLLAPASAISAEPPDTKAQAFADFAWRASRRCPRMCRRVSQVIPVTAPVPLAISLHAVGVSQEPAPADIARQIAELRVQVAELQRQQAEREAAEAVHPTVFGWGSVGSGGTRVRLGFSSGENGERE